MHLLDSLRLYRNRYSFETAVHQYLFACRVEGKTERTLQTYQETLYQVLNIARSIGIPARVSDFRPNHVYQLMDAVRMRGVSAGTQHRRFRETRAFFSWCLRMELISSHPFTGTSNVNIESKVIRPFSKADVEKLLSCCDNDTEMGVRSTAILLLLLDTGMQRAELEGLEVGDVDLDLGRAMLRHGKGRRQRIVPFSPNTGNVIRNYVSKYRGTDSGRLFLSVDRGQGRKALNKYHLGTLFQRLGDQAGVHANPHRFRHTFATWAIEAGAREIDVQYLLGHSTAVMTRRYAATYDASQAANRHFLFSPVAALINES